MKMLVVAMRIPYPLYSGYQVTMFNYLKALSEMGFSIHLFCVEDSKSGEVQNNLHKLQELIPGITKIGYCYIPMYIRIVCSVLGLFKGNPLQVGYFSNFFSRNALKKFCKPDDYEEILLHTVRLSKIIDRSLLERAVVFFADSIAMNYDQLKRSASMYLRPVFSLEANRLRWYEKQVGKTAKGSIFHSTTDTEYLGISEKCHIVPILKRNVPEFIPINESNLKRFLFIGKMSYAPNIEALEYLIQVLRENPQNSFTIDIIGASLSESLQAKVSETAGMRYLGTIEDLNAEIQNSYGVLSPIFTGAGMTNKILDALTSARPAIASGFSAAPYFKILEKETHGGIIVFSDAKEFINVLNKLVHDRDFTNQICKMSYKAGKVLSLESLPLYFKRIFPGNREV